MVKRHHSFGQQRPSWFDRIIRNLRFRRISREIKDGDVVVDLGCGYHADLLRYLELRIKAGIGVDLSVAQDLKSGKIKLIRGRVDQKINLKSGIADCVTGPAIIEHVDDQTTFLSEIYRLLKPGGVVLLTTPSRRARPILEFLAFRLQLISAEEIVDHKRYYNSVSLKKALKGAGFAESNIQVKKFQLGLNLFVRAER